MFTAGIVARAFGRSPTLTKNSRILQDGGARNIKKPFMAVG
jgi:hypothetical protein